MLACGNLFLRVRAAKGHGTIHAFLVSSGGKVAVKAADGGGESRIDVTGGEAKG
jgi:hypothetical protein